MSSQNPEIIIDSTSDAETSRSGKRGKQQTGRQTALTAVHKAPPRDSNSSSIVVVAETVTINVNFNF